MLMDRARSSFLLPLFPVWWNADSAASADDVSGTTSICRAAAKEKGSGRPTYYIHVSGTGLLTHQADKGQPRHGKIYNDWEGLPDLINFPAEAPHRNVDQIVLEAAKANPTTLRTAIVCPPVIYGPGRGPVNERAMITPLTVASMIKRGQGYLPTGDAAWHHVHVHDLSDLFIRLIRAAAEGGGKATWIKKDITSSSPSGWAGAITVKPRLHGSPRRVISLQTTRRYLSGICRRPSSK